MARRPFFGQNDTKIAKMDMQAATAPGRAYAAAFQKLGDIASDTLEKFREKKEEKEQQELSKNQIVNLYKGNPDHPVFKALDVQSIDEAKAVAGDFSKQPELLTQAMSFAKAVTDEKQAQEASQLRNLQMQELQQSMEGKKADRLRADQNRMSENQFMQSLMSQTASPQAQRQADIARPGLAALGNGDARNRFMQAQLEDPRNQKRVLDLNDRDFLDQFKGDPRQTERALAFIEKRRAAELASQPKPMTDREREELIKLKIANRKGLLDLDRIENPKPTTNPAYTEATLNAISDAENTLNSSKFATGFFGDRLKNIGGTAAANLKNSIDTIKASIGFDKLQDMRDKSPTGGALGQVSERELAQLNASLGSLEQSQDAEQFRRNLMRVKDHYQKYYKATMAQVKAYEQGLKFETEEEAMSWYDKNFPMGGKPASDNQTNIITKGGFVLTAPGN